MKTVATFAMAVLLGLGTLSSGAFSAGAAQTVGQGAESEAVVTRPRPRPRTRVYVRPPLYPYRSYHTIYPPAYPIEYPGPNAHRECVDSYVTEHRASGTVVTPRMRCWWVRG